MGAFGVGVIRNRGGLLLAVAVPRRGLRDVLAEARAIAYATWPVNVAGRGGKGGYDDGG